MDTGIPLLNISNPLRIKMKTNKAEVLRTNHALAQRVISELDNGRNLILSLDENTYTRNACGSASVGAHFRHNLDFVNNFLMGIVRERIDYLNRGRDLRIETDRFYAIEMFDQAAERIANLDNENLCRSIQIRSEVDLSVWLPSSVVRELEFIVSHTIHHHALIAEKLAKIGIHTEYGFGVAPSTLEFWREEFR